MKILLAPDRFAHYRYAIFNKIAEENELDIYAPKEVDKSGIELADEKNEKNQFNWYNLKGLFFKNVCFWQVGLISNVTFKRKYDLYIFWGDIWRLSTWISVIICKVLGSKVALWTHGLYGNERAFKLFFRAALYRMADYLILYGQHAKKQLEKNGFNADKIYVVNNSLDCDLQEHVYWLSKIDRSSKKNAVAKKDIIMVFVGRLEKVKKLSLAMQALSILNRKNTGYSFYLEVIGDGSERNNLNQLASSLNIDCYVKFHGACYDQAVLGPIIMKSDICISPGNVGLTAMQSLIYGTPVVTHNDATRQMPEYEAVREGISGSLFDYDSIESLSDAILRCVNFIESEKITPDTCREVVKRSYTPDFQMSVLSSLFSSLEKRN